MRQTAAARVYAETLFQVARRRDAVDRVAAEAEALREALAAPRLRSFLATPRLPAEEKKRVLRESLRELLSEETLRFLELVIDRERQDLLDEILTEFGVLVGELRNQQVLEVASAVPLEAGLRERLRETFARTTGREIVLRESVDPSLVAGLVVQLGDTRIDGSVRTRLENLRESMLRGARAPASAGT